MKHTRDNQLRTPLPRRVNRVAALAALVMLPASSSEAAASEYDRSTRVSNARLYGGEPPRTQLGAVVRINRLLREVGNVRVLKRELPEVSVLGPEPKRVVESCKVKWPIAMPIGITPEDRKDLSLFALRPDTDPSKKTLRDVVVNGVRLSLVSLGKISEQNATRRLPTPESFIPHAAKTAQILLGPIQAVEVDGQPRTFLVGHWEAGPAALEAASLDC